MEPPDNCTIANCGMSGLTEMRHVDAAFCLSRLQSLRRLPAQTKFEFYFQASRANVSQRGLTLSALHMDTWSFEIPQMTIQRKANVVKGQGKLNVFTGGKKEQPTGE